MKSETVAKVMIPVIIISVMAIGVYLQHNQYDEFTYLFDDLQINTVDNISLMLLDGCEQGNVGGWMLPIKTISLVYPNNYDIDKVLITYPEESILDIEYEPYQLIDICEDGEYIQTNTTSYYSSIEYIGGYPTLQVTLYPVEYRNNSLIYREKINVYIIYTLDQQSRISEIGISKDEITFENNRWKSSYDNIQLSDEYEGGICSSNETVDYVIVTKEFLVDSFETLRSHRENFSGISCRIVTIEDILNNPSYVGVDNAEQLREFCKDAYLDWNTQYIVLGGGWVDITPSEQIIPYRLLTDTTISLEYKDMPSDIYYSNLDGDWKYNSELWGGGKGGANDYDSELIVGRIPIFNSDMADKFIDKIISYEINSTNKFLRSVMFCGADLGWTVESKDYLEEIRIGESPYADFIGFDEWNQLNYNILMTNYIYYDADYGSSAIGMWRQSIKDDNCSFINYLGHGNPYNVLNLGSNYVLNNKQYPIVVSGSCLSGRFNAKNCVVNTYTSKYDYGFSLMILNTGYGWGSGSTTNGATQYMHRYIIDYFFTNHPNDWEVGNSLDYARDKISNVLFYKSNAWTYAWYSMNLFGDPAMKYQIPMEDNIYLYVGHNQLIYNGDTTSIKDIAEDIGLINEEAVLVNHNGIWYSWIVGFSTDDMNEIVFNGDLLDIIVENQYTWVI
jgi:hypothetical protein